MKFLKRIIECEETLITIIVFQFLVFYGTADFTKFIEAPPNKWDKTWYIMEAFMYALIAAHFALKKREKRFVAVWQMLAGFFLLRLTWITWAINHGWDVNIKIAMATLFFIISSITFF